MNYLINHAVDNVWCTPGQDNQYVLKPSRVTNTGGAINTYQVNWDTIPLPDRTSYYHIYQIGQLHPDIINLFNIKKEWV